MPAAGAGSPRRAGDAGDALDDADDANDAVDECAAGSDDPAGGRAGGHADAWDRLDGGAPERGAEGYASFTPSMFGDAFGGPATTLCVRVPQTVRIGDTVFQAPPSNRVPAVFQIDTSGGATTFRTPPQGAFVFGRQITESYIASGPPNPSVPGFRVFPLLENSQDRAATLAFAQRSFAGDTIQLIYNPDTSVSAATEVAGGVNIKTAYDYSFLPFECSQVQLASPTNPGFVGITKIADDNSPLPRDRVIFNYDFFSAVPLNMRGVPIHRIVPGFEKTFLDQNASIEVRVPFASTLSTDLVSDGSATNTTTEFGNVNVTLKGLLYGDETIHVAAGLGIALPTADPVRVYSALDGMEVIRVQNDSILLTPYIAYLLTPGEGFFFQNWIACAFTTIGNQVLANQDLTGLKKVGRLYDQHQLQIDAQMGYWLVYPDESGGFLQGLAPFELHWNSNISTAPSIVLSNQVLTPPNTRFNEFNLSAGALFQLGDAVNLTVGAAIPLLNNSNRMFDYQLGVRCSVFFGPTLRNRIPPTSIQTF